MKKLLFLLTGLLLISCGSSDSSPGAGTDSGSGQSDICREQCSSDRDCPQSEVCFKSEDICNYPVCISKIKAADYEKAR